MECLLTLITYNCVVDVLCGMGLLYSCIIEVVGVSEWEVGLCYRMDDSAPPAGMLPLLANVCVVTSMNAVT